MNKEIYFCLDEESLVNCALAHEDYYVTKAYDTTEFFINKDVSLITLSLAQFSFDLIDKGYDIYLCYREKVKKIEPHMDLSGCGEPCKDLRFGHNIFKLLRAGIFNDLLGYKF